MEYSYYISNLIKEVNSSLGRDSLMNPDNRELLTKTLESFIPFISNPLDGKDTDSEDRSKLISNVNKYIKQKLHQDIDEALNEIDDCLNPDNIDNYSIGDLNLFRKELNDLIEEHLQK